MEMRWLAWFFKKNSKFIILLYIIVSSILSGIYSARISIDSIMSGQGDSTLIESCIALGLINGVICIILHNISER